MREAFFNLRGRVCPVSQLSDLLPIPEALGHTRVDRGTCASDTHDTSPDRVTERASARRPTGQKVGQRLGEKGVAWPS